MRWAARALICVFLVTRPLFGTLNFYILTLTLGFDDDGHLWNLSHMGAFVFDNTSCYKGIVCGQLNLQTAVSQILSEPLVTYNILLLTACNVGDEGGFAPNIQDNKEGQILNSTFVIYIFCQEMSTRRLVLEMYIVLFRFGFAGRSH
jgi:hypothetical protein